MTSKTDKNFIYDYLIHLDSFLLHGVSEVGASQARPVSPPPAKKSNFPPYRNLQSPIAFVGVKSGNQTQENSLAKDELELFNKIVIAMGLNPHDIFLTSINNSEPNSLTKLSEDLSQTNCKYVVCLGLSIANNLSGSKSESYDRHACWQEMPMFQKNIVLITTPSIREMLEEPRHKKLAWAQLKRAADQIQSE